MRHQIVSDDLRAPEMAEAVEKCVHCGFCLAACPTYNLLGEEMDSPRGRIYLMKSVLEENLPYGRRCPALYRSLPGLPGLCAGLPLWRGLWRPAFRATAPFKRRAAAAPAFGCPGTRKPGL